VQPKWFDAGAKDYGFPPLALLSLEFLLLGFLELKRYQGFKKTGKVMQDCCTRMLTQCMDTLFMMSLDFGVFLYLGSHKMSRTSKFTAQDCLKLRWLPIDMTSETCAVWLP
jgi:hypothetical protein